MTASLWRVLAPQVMCATPVCLRLDDVHDTHYGVLDLVRIHRDGSCLTRFTDGTTVTIPALKEHRT